MNGKLISFISLLILMVIFYVSPAFAGMGCESSQMKDDIRGWVTIKNGTYDIITYGGAKYKCWGCGECTPLSQSSDGDSSRSYRRQQQAPKDSGPSDEDIEKLNKLKSELSTKFHEKIKNEKEEERVKYAENIKILYKAMKPNPILTSAEKESFNKALQSAYCAAYSSLKAAKIELSGLRMGLNTEMEEMRETSSAVFDKQLTDCPKVEISIPYIKTSQEFENLNFAKNKFDEINKNLNQMIPLIKKTKNTLNELDEKIKENEKQLLTIKKKKSIVKNAKQKEELEQKEDDLVKAATQLLNEAKKQENISNELNKTLQKYETEFSSTVSLMTSKGVK